MLRKELLTVLGFFAGGAVARRAVVGAPVDAVTVPQLGKPLKAPIGKVPLVAFLIGPDLVPIDLFGPQGVFLDAAMATADMHSLFAVTTVAESRTPVDAHGMTLQPAHTLDAAPRPDVLIVPAQRGSPAVTEYIRHTAASADVVASICTGAFLVAKAGLFDGGRATTHHSAYDEFAKRFPQVTLIRGPRYVEDPLAASSGGESSGIDLALRIVERYYGASAASAAAYNMEYRRTTRPTSERDV